MARTDRVVVKTAFGTVELPWDSRQALLTQIRHLGSAKPIVDAFEAVGTTRPVVLTEEQRGQLGGLLNFWAQQVHVPGLPEGVWDLRCALVDEFAKPTHPE